jgi:amidohydrolase
LEENGFTVERGIAGLSTALKATFHTGRTGPHLAYLAEYDALPEIGHGCGHNIIGTAAVFSAITLRKLAEKLSGQITVFGTPDEEGAGGKIPIVKAGFFRDVDAVIMTHPWNFTSPWMPSVGVASLTIEFTGKSAHYSTPHRGSNALDGVVLTLATLNGLRHNFRNDVVYGYTIDQGGVSPSIVPEKASARLWIKSTDLRNLLEVVDRVKACAEGIAKSIGATVKVAHHYPLFEESIPNLALMQELARNFMRLGIPFRAPEETSRSLVYVSTDYGNVSHVVPGISPAISIGSENLSAHTPEFAEAAISKRGSDALIDITKAMAMTGIDVLNRPEVVESAKAEFVKYREAGFSNVPLAPIY